MSFLSFSTTTVRFLSFITLNNKTSKYWMKIKKAKFSFITK